MFTLNRTLAVFATSALIATGAASAVSAQDVVIVFAGGTAQDAHRQAVWTPAAEALGIEFAEDTSQNWTDAKAQVDAGAVSWDIINLSMGQVQLAVDAGILVKLPIDIVDRSQFAPGTVNDYCVGNTVFSQIISYNTDMWGDNGPENMVDFFDTAIFDGVRGLTRGARGNIEGAAMALGNSHDEVYPFLSTEEGLDAAFEKLAELIASSEVIWWESGAQLTQLIIDGQIDLSYGWDGRIVTAQDEGAPVRPVYQDGILDTDCYAILKGGPNTETAIEFLAEISKAEYTKDLVKYIAYGSPNLRAYDDYSAETLSRLTSSPANVAGQMALGVDFWGENGTMLSERFDAMLLSTN